MTPEQVIHVGIWKILLAEISILKHKLYIELQYLCVSDIDRTLMTNIDIHVLESVERLQNVLCYNTVRCEWSCKNQVQCLR